MKHSTAGAHRKLDTSAKRRTALVAVASSAVATAGFTGVATGSTQSNTDTEHTTILAQGTGSNAANTGTSGSTTSAATQSPQILEVPQAKVVSELGNQLSNALRFAEQRIAADEAARAPKISSPAEGTFTSGFGLRWGAFHHGIDIANAIGTHIRAVQDGTVIDSGPASGYGNWIRIKADDGTITVYGHMASLAVAVGERVTAGQVIAGMGSEGFSTGSHLHFEVHPDGGEAIDPLPWLAERGIVF